MIRRDGWCSEVQKFKVPAFHDQIMRIYLSNRPGDHHHNAQSLKKLHLRWLFRQMESHGVLLRVRHGGSGNYRI